MADSDEYIIDIYHVGALMNVRCAGREAYLSDNDFLNKLTGREYRYDQSVPDPIRTCWTISSTMPVWIFEIKSECEGSFGSMRRRLPTMDLYSMVPFRSPTGYEAYAPNDRAKPVMSGRKRA